MHHISRLIGVFATVVLFGWTTMGCVDQEASLKLRGLVSNNGTINTENVNCGEGGNEDPVPKPTLSCDTNIEPGSAENFLTALWVDIGEYERTGGQLGTDNGTLLSDDEFCALDDPNAYRDLKYRNPSFVATFDATNQLEDSREVGSQGQGGGGGGFSGLELNMNDVQTRTFKMRFPDVPETAPSQLGIDRDIDFTMVVDSGGGGATFNLELLSLGDTERLKQLHEAVVRQRAGLSSYDQTARETTVTLTSEMWVEGETVGGRPVESNKLTFPVKICGEGCGLTPRCNFQSSGN